MASNEEHAYEIMSELDVDYVLVIFGGLTGYSSDDINKFLWMVSFMVVFILYVFRFVLVDRLRKDRTYTNMTITLKMESFELTRMVSLIGLFIMFII